MPRTEPSPGEKGDRSASIGITILIINLAVAVDEEIHVTRCKILFGARNKTAFLREEGGAACRDGRRKRDFRFMLTLS